MKISFFVKTGEGYQILAKTSHIDKALEILKQIKADGVFLDIPTAKMLLSKSSETSTTSQPRTHVVSKTHQRIQRVPVNEIDYFQADQKYVTVHHTQGTLLIEDTLKELEIEFVEQFVRIHRTLLVNIDRIESIQRDDQGFYWLKIRQSETLFPISRRKIAQVRKRI